MSTYFTNRLTPPANLGLLALSSRRVLPGRAARGSVVPRKMACPLARGAFHGDCGPRLSTRAQGRGSPVAAPSNWGGRASPLIDFPKAERDAEGTNGGNCP